MFNLLANLLFPPKCIFCGSLLNPGSGIDICSICYGKIPFIPIERINAEKGFFKSRNCDGVVCACEYAEIIKESIVRYKFFNKSGYYRTFAALLSERLKKMTNCRNFDIIVSVPLHKQRENIRGYNQALLISKAVSKKTGVPEMSFLLSRIRNTSSQSLLNRKARIENVKNAFRVNTPDKVKDKVILLVDDILTTGNTIEECSKVLKEAGAKNVFAAVIASGKKY